MSEKLVLPREWTRKTQAPIWKAAAIAGWAFSMLLAQCLVLVLAWPRGTQPVPPPPALAPPAPPPAAHNGEEIQVSNSMARIRCLVNVGRSQEALAETIRCLSFCQRAQIDPPGELPALFAQTVAGLPERRVTPKAERAATGGPAPALPVQLAVPGPRPASPPVCGRMPGCGYPQARSKCQALAQLPQAGRESMLPPVPPQDEQSGDRTLPGGPFPFQPERQQPPPAAGSFPGGFPPPPPGYDSAPVQPQPNW